MLCLAAIDLLVLASQAVNEVLLLVTRLLALEGLCLLFFLFDAVLVGKRNFRF